MNSVLVLDKNYEKYQLLHSLLHHINGSLLVLISNLQEEEVNRNQSIRAKLSEIDKQI